MPITNYLWDPDEDNIVKELSDGGNTTADYTTEPFLYGDLISQHRDGQPRFYHFDTQGSTTELTDRSGNTTDTRRYSAFGEVTASTGITDFPFQFVGQKQYHRGSQAGTFTVRRRMYKPITARWQSVDPSGGVDGLLTRYVYAQLTPLNAVDPSGLIDVWAKSDIPQQVVCGQTVRMGYSFILRQPAPCEGYIVQMVAILCAIEDCRFPELCPQVVSASATFRYWEAWPVGEDDIVSTTTRRGGVTDVSRATAYHMRCGYYIQRTSIKFFCKDKNHPASGGTGTGDLGDVPNRPPPPNSGWSAGGVYGTDECATDTVTLASTGDEPDWWTKEAVRGPAGRTLGLYYRCCDADCGGYPNFVRYTESATKPTIPPIPE